MATDYNKLKVTELKEILKVRGIPQTGLSRKQQIVEALEQHDAEQDVGGSGEAEEVEEGSMEVENGTEEAVQPDEAAVVAPTGETGDAEHKPEGPGDTEQPSQEDLPVDAQDAKPTQTVPEVDTTSDEQNQPAQPSAPLVLERNEPVSKEPSRLATPQQTSPEADSLSSDTRKRKRRSPTPPLSEDSVNKKLRAATGEPIVTLPEDRAVEEKEEVIQEAPVAVDTKKEGDVILPFGSSDDVMEVDTANPVDTTDSEAAPVAPAIHPATRALYIRDLVRPLQTQQLRSHLVKVATPPGGKVDDTVIETFHVDTIRTHAFVVFTTVSAATRARPTLHARIWPDEPTRKPLWVDFVPEEKVDKWIEIEKEGEQGSGRGGVRRWEINYVDGENGIEARLEEAGSLASGPGRQQSFSATSTQGAPSTGPQGPQRPSRTPLSPEEAKRPTPAPAPAPHSSSFNVLDERFRHTTTKPKLYYLPKDPSLVSQRLDALASITSRDWIPEREGSFTGRGEVKRYTFEDGDRVVDGGPDIGNFGRPRGMEIGGRAGGRGGYRGGRR